MPPGAPPACPLPQPLPSPSGWRSQSRGRPLPRPESSPPRADRCSRCTAQVGGTDRAPTRLAWPTAAAAAAPGTAHRRRAPLPQAGGQIPQPRRGCAVVRSGSMELTSITESMNDVGFSSPLVVKALEKLADQALLRKRRTGSRSDPSRKFISPASPVVGALVLGARPSQQQSARRVRWGCVASLAPSDRGGLLGDSVGGGVGLRCAKRRHLGCRARGGGVAGHRGGVLSPHLAVLGLGGRDRRGVLAEDVARHQVRLLGAVGRDDRRGHGRGKGGLVGGGGRIGLGAGLLGLGGGGVQPPDDTVRPPPPCSPRTGQASPR